MDVTQTIFLSMAVAGISFTVTETKLCGPLRNWMKSKNSRLGTLFSCGYCLGHWVAFFLALLYMPRMFDFWFPLDVFLTALSVAWMGAFQWALMCWIMDKTGK